MLSPHGEPNIDRRLLAAKADEIDATLRRLRAMSRGLRHAAACRAPSHAQCPTFQRLLKAAAAGALDHRRRRGELNEIDKDRTKGSPPTAEASTSRRRPRNAPRRR
jgi:hypothetical protein